MVIRTTEQWQVLFKQHNESDMTAAQFCRENNLCPKYFAKRKKELNGPTDKTIKPTLVKLTKAKSNRALPTVTLEYGKMTLNISDTVSPQWLAQLAKALA